MRTCHYILLQEDAMTDKPIMRRVLKLNNEGYLDWPPP
jgi:hypothetical protein